MVERETLVGFAFLIVGALFIVGYGLAQLVPGSFLAGSVPIAALAIALAIIGAVILLVVPGSASEEAYKALLNDATRDIGMLMEEIGLNEKAYFLQTQTGEIRAFIPISNTGGEGGESGPHLNASSHLGLESSRLVVDNGNQKGLLLIPPGAQLVKLAKVEKGADLEGALRSVLVDFSGIASSVLALEEKGSRVMRVQIREPTISWESSSLSQCLGSPASCVAGCVVAAVKGETIRIVEEKVDSNLVLLSLVAV